jgi:hypothetical protein
MYKVPIKILEKIKKQLEKNNKILEKQIVAGELKYDGVDEELIDEISFILLENLVKDNEKIIDLLKTEFFIN